MSGDGFVGNMMGNMDEQQARKIINSLSEDDIHRALQWMANDYILPHLEDVKKTARTRDDPHAVREYYESLPDDESEEVFYDTLDELVAVIVECRQRPRKGTMELKAMLRDPYTVEALLLIFENEEHIDHEYSKQLKDFASTHLRWVGAMILPEMYDEHEVERVLDTFDIDARDGQANVGR